MRDWEYGYVTNSLRRQLDEMMREIETKAVRTLNLETQARESKTEVAHLITEADALRNLLSDLDRAVRELKV